MIEYGNEIRFLFELLKEETCSNNRRAVFNALKALKDLISGTLSQDPILLTIEEPALMGIIEGKTDNFIILIGHIDISCEELKSHENEYYRVIRLDDDVVVVGRGVSDMKGGLVSLILTLNSILKRGVKPSINIIYYIMSDEELGSHSVNYLLEFIKKHDINSFKGIIAYEPTDVYWYVIGNLNNIGTQLFIMDVYQDMDEIVNTIKEHVTSWIKETDKYHINSMARNIIKDPRLYEIINTSIKHYSAFLDYSIAEAFESVLIEVYGYEELSHERRVMAMDIISLLYNLSDLIGIFRKLKTQLEFIDDVILYEYKKFTMTSPSSDLCIGIRRSAWKNLGLGIKPLISPSAGPEPIFRTMGIPTILYGPGFTINLHSDFEIVSLRNIRLIARIIEDLIVNWGLGRG